jgi:ORC complex protein Cdc6/Orc1
MRDHLFELVMPGIVSVTERNGGRRGGTFREHELNMDESLLLNSMDNTVNNVGLHASLEDYLIDDSDSDVVSASIGDSDSEW